jgi:hypothetical protein
MGAVAARRSIGDYVRDAFFARDKATLAAIVKDAEEAVLPMPPVEGEHKEPDGDEDDNQRHSVHVHVEHGKDAAALEGRVGKIEDSLKALDTKITSFFDAIIKDGDLPPWLQKGGEGGEGEDPPKDDDKDPPPPPPEDPTKDEDVKEGETGALSAEKLTAAEPELMDADGSLKTGPMKMGDAAYVAAVQKGIGRLVRDVRARAEILSPGIKFQTIDAKPGMGTAKALCDMRRQALGKAGKAALGRFTSDSIKGMSCESVRVLFLDASDRQAAANKLASSQQGYVTGDDVFTPNDTQVGRLKAINTANRDFWSKQTNGVRH